MIAATALLVMLVLPSIVIVRARPIDAIVALQLFSTTMIVILLCLAEGFHSSVYFNVPLVCALCVWVGSLVLVRFVGRFT